MSVFVSQKALGTLLAWRQIASQKVTMHPEVFERENGSGFYTVFTFEGDGEEFARRQEEGDWRDEGSDANSVFNCLHELYEIKLKEED